MLNDSIQTQIWLKILQNTQEMQKLNPSQVYEK